MPNIESVLKTEMARVARKEVRAEVESLKKASAQHPSAVAQLRRQLGDIEKQLKLAQRRGVAQSPGHADAGAEVARRFSASRLAAHRAKLGLSAASYGRLVEMSRATIYLWEQGKARPNAEQLKRLAIVRSLGRRAIEQRLSSAEAQIWTALFRCLDALVTRTGRTASGPRTPKSGSSHSEALCVGPPRAVAAGFREDGVR